MIPKKKKPPIRDEKVLVRITMSERDEWQPKRRRDIADWLRYQADLVEHEKPTKFNANYRARFVVTRRRPRG